MRWLTLLSRLGNSAIVALVHRISMSDFEKWVNRGSSNVEIAAVGVCLRGYSR